MIRRKAKITLLETMHNFFKNLIFTFSFYIALKVTNFFKNFESFEKMINSFEKCFKKCPSSY